MSNTHKADHVSHLTDRNTLRTSSARIQGMDNFRGFEYASDILVAAGARRLITYSLDRLQSL